MCRGELYQKIAQTFCRFEEEMNKKKGKRGIRSCKIFKIMYISSYNATLSSREYPKLLHGAWLSAREAHKTGAKDKWV